MKHPKYAQSFEVIQELPESLRQLSALASNFRWTWHHPTQELFRSIDKDVWERVEHNPVQLINSLSAERLDRLQQDASILAELNYCAGDLQKYLDEEPWFDKAYPGKREETRIAYFCAEFGISESLPIYSGGLGVLAGDHLKAASDLGLPLVGVGLLYSRGYFRQVLGADGWQQEHYPQYDFYRMPLTLMRGENQQPLRVEVEFPDRTIVCQIWRADVGRVQLYLLDSNVLENAPSDQEITDTLYGGNEEMRIAQEMILGVGGMRALRAVGINPTVCHMNEGHAGFMILERIRQFMSDNQCDFKTARKVIVGSSVFTTHTPVPAGFDLFPSDLLERYTASAVKALGISFEEFVAFGVMDPENEGEKFNMALLAIENSNYINGVSKLHASVSRSMFQQKWPNYPEDETPIEAVTNGIHTLTWISRRMGELFDRYLDPSWRRRPEYASLWEGVLDIPDAALWEARENQRGDLVRNARVWLQRALEHRGSDRSELSAFDQILDPRFLTIGFARRFATYKRATLMLSDPERLKRILFHPERPVQILVAGKSHPRDDGGKKLIQDLYHFIRDEGTSSRIVFLEDYDMSVARSLVQGVDVWLNNPRRPLEASGTSGMKVVPNGGLNCSVLDGWWDEGYMPGVGWSIGERRDYSDQGQQDFFDSRSLYWLLENEIAPKFYSRMGSEVPTAWIQMIKRSIMILAPQFCTGRMVSDYGRRFYVPASECYGNLAGNGMERAKSAIQWQAKVDSEWGKVRIHEVNDNAPRRTTVGTSIQIQATVELGPFSPDEVRVEGLVGDVGPNRDLINIEPLVLERIEGEGSRHTFFGTLSCSQSGHKGYIVRVKPHHPDVVMPNEVGEVTWQSGH
ncbi:MAG: alpha-glucan family phosphorylase [Fimbriimonadaceae bacterium]|nr:alpha-glucan family phosphorylase [Fimbriimonadaceae bacterium]